MFYNVIRVKEYWGVNMEDKEIVYLQLEDIIPNRFQPREVFDEKALKELAVSIKEHGVIQPIIVRKVDDKYEIIAGERRYKAAELAKLKKIPAIVRDLDDKESSKVALLENLQRKNLNPMEEARTFQKILDLDEMTQEDLAKTMGKSQSAVANKLRLLALPKKVQEALIKEQISERHARALLNLDDDSKKEELVDKIINSRMTVREVEEEIKAMNKDKVIDEDNLPEVPIEVEEEKELPKEEIPSMEDIKPQTDDVNLGIGNFINQDFIKPDEVEEKSKKEFGEVTFAPPEEDKKESQQDLPKFINYGEIDDDEDESEEKTLSNSTNIDIDELKNNTQDINVEDTKKPEDLDSLLKVKPSVVEEKNDEEPSSFKFIKPEKEEKEEQVEEKTITDNPMDYFVSPDIIPTENSEEKKLSDDNNEDKDESILDQVLSGDNQTEKESFDENGDFVEEDLPEVPIDEQKEKPYIYVPDSIKDKTALTSILMSDGVQTFEESKIETISLKDAISEIRKTVNDLEKQNIYIETEEIDLPNNYQINIKIRKDEE